MILDEAVANVQRALGFRTQHADAIVAMIQQRQADLEQGVPSPQGRGTYLPRFLETMVDLDTSGATVVTGTGIKVALPEGFLSEKEPGGLEYYNPEGEEGATKWTGLRKGDFDVLQKAYPNKGSPKAYSLLFDGYLVIPEPEAGKVYQLRASYYKADTVPTLGGTNLWLTYAPYTLIGWAGKQAAMGTTSADRVGYFAEMEASALQKLYSFGVQQDTDNRQYQIGGPL